MDASELAHLERLAALRTPEDARAQLCADLARILAQCESLDRIAEEPPAPAPLAHALREDVPRPGLDRARALAAAPASDGEHFVVPRILP